MQHDQDVGIPDMGQGVDMTLTEGVPRHPAIPLCGCFQMGYGSRALQLLQMYYEGRFPCLEEKLLETSQEIHTVSSEVSIFTWDGWAGCGRQGWVGGASVRALLRLWAAALLPAQCFCRCPQTSIMWALARSARCQPYPKPAESETQVDLGVWALRAAQMVSMQCQPESTCCAVPTSVPALKVCCSAVHCLE